MTAFREVFVGGRVSKRTNGGQKSRRDTGVTEGQFRRTAAAGSFSIFFFCSTLKQQRPRLRSLFERAFHSVTGVSPAVFTAWHEAQIKLAAGFFAPREILVKHIVHLAGGAAFEVGVADDGGARVE